VSASLSSFRFFLFQYKNYWWYTEIVKSHLVVRQRKFWEFLRYFWCSQDEVCVIDFCVPVLCIACKSTRVVSAVGVSSTRQMYLLMVDRADDTFYTKDRDKKSPKRIYVPWLQIMSWKRLNLLPLVSLNCAPDLFALLLMAVIALH